MSDTQAAPPGPITVKRGVTRGKPYWVVYMGDRFVCRAYAEAAVRTTVARLRQVYGGGAGT